VQTELNKLVHTVTNKDTVLIFLAGHGLQINARDFYFATHDIDFAHPDTTGLPWTALTDVLAKLPAKRVVLFLDACHSGSALGTRQARSERMAEALARESGVIVFSSCRGSEYSYELDQLGHGAFTQALIEGLGDGKANFSVDGAKSTTISAEEILAYLRLRVPQLTENQQTPSCPLLQDFGDPFPLVTD
jgi:uncharacterized caspase-like protein